MVRRKKKFFTSSSATRKNSSRFWLPIFPWPSALLKLMKNSNSRFCVSGPVHLRVFSHAKAEGRVLVYAFLTIHGWWTSSKHLALRLRLHLRISRDRKSVG